MQSGCSAQWPHNGVGWFWGCLGIDEHNEPLWMGSQYSGRRNATGGCVGRNAEKHKDKVT